MVGVSYATEAPDYEMLQNLTFGTTTQEYRTASQASWSWREVAVSVFVLAVILGGYLYFTG
jgi:SSS family solute:Na+ symporter